MKLSVIVPAYNEEKLIGRCLTHVFDALRANASDDWSAEVIVVDNNSTDRTAELALAAGAMVVFEPINQISRARNAGGRHASGDWLLFVDADSYLHPRTVAELLQCIRRGKDAAGGCEVWLDEPPAYVLPMLRLCNFLMRTMRWAAGSFLFCRRDAFLETGGFSTQLYATEEIEFSSRLRRWAGSRDLGFRILTDHFHVSSARKFKLHTRGEFFAFALRALFLLPWTIRDRKKLDYFYDGRR